MLCPQCWNSIVHARGPTRCWESRNISLRILEIAMPREPVGWDACERPASVRSDGERCTVAPHVSIIERL